MTQPDTSSLLGGGGGVPGFTWEPGVEHTLTVTDKAVRERTKFGTGETEYWPDGKPKMQIVLTGTVDESERQDSDDTLERRMYLKTGLLAAVKQAIAEAGLKDIDLGAKVWAKCTSEERNANGFKQKNYVAKVKAPEAATASLLSGGDGLRAPAGKAAKSDDEPPF